jgi:hypothetical protein
MAQHHVHWNADLKWLAVGVFALWLITRPKSPPKPLQTTSFDDYRDANGVTWSLEQPAGAPLPVPHFLAQALDGAYAGATVGPVANAALLKQAIDKYAAEHKS